MKECPGARVRLTARATFVTIQNKWYQGLLNMPTRVSCAKAEACVPTLTRRSQTAGLLLNTRFACKETTWTTNRITAHCFLAYPTPRSQMSFNGKNKITLPHGYNFAALLPERAWRATCTPARSWWGRNSLTLRTWCSGPTRKSRRFLNAKTRARRTHCAKRGSSRRTTPCVKRRLQRQLHTLKLTMESVS